MLINSQKPLDDGFNEYLQKLKNKIQRAKKSENYIVLIATDGIEKVIIYRYISPESVKVFSYLNSKVYAKRLYDFLKENAIELDDYMVPLGLYNKIGLSYFEINENKL